MMLYFCFESITQYTTLKLKSQENMKKQVFTPSQIKRRERDEKVAKECKELLSNPDNKKAAVWSNVGERYNLCPLSVFSIYKRAYGSSR